MLKFKKIPLAVAVAFLAILFGLAGRVSTDVSYDSQAKVVYNIFNPKLSCMGMVTVERHRGYQPFSPEGPYWINNEVFGIYFKNGPEHPSDFYLTIYSDTARTVTATHLVESVGSVQLLPDDYVLIELKYKDADGKWIVPWINGRRKIDLVLPEGRRH